MEELPVVTIELKKGLEEKGRTFSLQGLDTFMVMVNEWLTKEIYNMAVYYNDQNKCIKKMAVKLQFTEVIADE
jgi:hypothetical protein